MPQIERGELYWVDWNPGRGSEQTGIRPTLIIQNDIGNKLSTTTIVAACSTAPVKRYPFIVPVTARDSGLPKDCAINLSAIMTIEQSRLRDRAGKLTEDRMREVDQAIKNSLGLDQVP